MSDDDALCAKRLVDQIGSILHGQGEVVQSAALADLLAQWLAGHIIAGDPVATTQLRADLLCEHMRLVRDLIQPNEQMILERLKRESH